jgi:hypothetical protein
VVHDAGVPAQVLFEVAHTRACVELLNTATAGLYGLAVVESDTPRT